MKAFIAILTAFLILSPLIIAAENSTGTMFDGDNTMLSPWADDGKICFFVREWVQKGMFLVILLVFLTGVATISGAAFPEWRDYGSKMILGALGSMVLYILGLGALNLFMGVKICGLGV